MENLLQDARYSVRNFFKNPGFTVVVVMTLALGIGANTALFSIVNSVILRPLHFPESDSLIAIWEKVPDEMQSRYRVTAANFFDWRDQSQTFEEMAAFGAAAMSLTGAGEPEQLRGVRVTIDYFKVLRIEPLLGRSFAAEENQAGKNNVVILSEGLWQRRFASDRELIGKSITLDDTSYAVIGVMPSGLYPAWPVATAKFSFQPGQQQFWVPIAETAELRNNRRSHVFGAIGRLKSDATLAQAQAEMESIAGNLAEQYPQFNAGESVILNPFIEEMVGNVRSALFILFGAVGFVLLIACANVASLLLARLAARRKEIAIRTALGAGRLRLVRQFLVEGLLLSLAGGAIGTALAGLGTDLILKLIPLEIPRLDQTSLDRDVLIFTLLISIVTSLLFGLAPAWQATRGNLNQSLREGGRSSSAAEGRQRFRKTLVAVQIGLAVTLVIGAGLLIRSFIELQSVSPGFNPNRVLLAELSIPQSRYSEIHQVSGFYARLLERVGQIPGVESASFTYDHPLEANWIDTFSIEGRPAPAQGESLSGWMRPVGAGYFRTMGVEVLRGREFTDQDDTRHSGAVIINELFARTHFPDENPLGKRLTFTTPRGMWNDTVPAAFEIVGVVRNEKFLGLSNDSEPAFYLPDKQFPQFSMLVMIRTAGDPLTIVSSVRDAVWSVDRDQAIARIETMENLMSSEIARQKFNMFLMAMFGATALMLASLGVFGLLSYQVAQRTHEFGVRMALGARPRDVFHMVIRQGMTLTIVGLAAGMIASLLLTRLLASLLFGVTATDPVTFAGVALLLALVALVACLIPARRATKVDPIVALRYE